MKYLFLLFLCSCGNSFLSEGDYDITLTVTYSNWGLAKGHVSESVWNIAEDSDNYTITIEGSDTILRGYRQKKDIIFDLFTEFSGESAACKQAFNVLYLVITPSPGKFIGNSYSDLRLCNITTCPMGFPTDGTDTCGTEEVDVEEEMDVFGILKEK